MTSNLIKVMQEASAAVLQHISRDVTIFHHNDTDGLSSGAVLTAAFEKTGFRVSRFALEKPYPQILTRIFAKEDQLLIFADFAGKIAPLIAKMNGGRNTVLILDHHPAEDVSDPSVFNLDAELFGIKGDRDISASAVCALFADVLLERNGISADFLSHLGVLGAIGDGFLVDGALSGVNRELLKKAEACNLMRTVTGDSVEEYFITLGGEEYPASAICEVLDTLGGAGYYRGGPEKGIEVCRNGIASDIMEEVANLIKTKDGIFRHEIDNLKNNLITTDHLQWFNVEERFAPMGVKMIGVFCTVIKDMDLLDKTKYLAGFQTVPDTIPGFGEVNFDSTKISMRVSGYLTERIRSGNSPGLNSFLPKATINIGGFVDACHGLSAATTVRIGEEQKLIEEIEKELIERMKNNG